MYGIDGAGPSTTVLGDIHTNMFWGPGANEISLPTCVRYSRFGNFVHLAELIPVVEVLVYARLNWCSLRDVTIQYLCTAVFHNMFKLFLLYVDENIMTRCCSTYLITQAISRFIRIHIF